MNNMTVWSKACTVFCFTKTKKKVDDIHASYERAGADLKAVECRLREMQPLAGAAVMMRLADCCFEEIGTEVEYEFALEYYRKAERLFYNRL